MWNETDSPWMNLVTNKSKLSSPVMVWILLNTSSRASCDSSLESILCSFILHPWANKCHYHQHDDSHNILYIGDVRTQSSRAKIQPGFVASQAVRSFLWGKWEPSWRGWLNGRSQNLVLDIPANESYTYCSFQLGVSHWSWTLRSLHLVVMNSLRLHSCAISLSRSFISALCWVRSFRAFSFNKIILDWASALNYKNNKLFTVSDPNL